MAMSIETTFQAGDRNILFGQMKRWQTMKNQLVSSIRIYKNTIYLDSHPSREECIGSNRVFPSQHTLDASRSSPGVNAAAAAGAAGLERISRSDRVIVHLWDTWHTQT
ncbi:unnamed protein product [Protopolystoma xenopodis]|uniref:Uncharacterized protein n=1 Tax=Protopolystoma xenopodis TaxID=117903 RepID=A0A448XAL7_9PLAT|nr:unnamed protein product [Protopolystoma xenopodis]